MKNLTLKIPGFLNSNKHGYKNKCQIPVQLSGTMIQNPAREDLDQQGAGEWRRPHPTPPAPVQPGLSETQAPDRRCRPVTPPHGLLPPKPPAQQQQDREGTSLSGYTLPCFHRRGPLLACLPKSPLEGSPKVVPLEIPSHQPCSETECRSSLPPWGHVKVELGRGGLPQPVPGHHLLAWLRWAAELAHARPACTQPRGPQDTSGSQPPNRTTRRGPGQTYHYPPHLSPHPLEVG